MPKQHENDPTMNDSVHQMSLLVGQIMGKVDGLTRSVENLNVMWGEREKAATEGRRVVHEKVDAMRHDLMRVDAVVENVSRDVANVIRPAVETLTSERDEHQGAAKEKKRILAGMVTLSGILGGGISELFHRFLH